MSLSNSLTYFFNCYLHNKLQEDNIWQIFVSLINCIVFFSVDKKAMNMKRTEYIEKAQKEAEEDKKQNEETKRKNEKYALRKIMKVKTNLQLLLIDFHFY